MSTVDIELSRILEIIRNVAEATAGGDYIYRGEPQHYEKVSSSLWRACRQELGTEAFDIEIIQERMLAVAKDYTHEEDNFEILTEIQHYGGHTNLIDFTTDTDIALFFACDGSHDKDGRLILLETVENIQNRIRPPRHPQNRVITQKSVFFQPPKGFVEPNQYEIINIPKSLKGQILDYLQKQHGISRPVVYNDLHGFIRNQHIHQGTYMDAYKGEARLPEPDLDVD